MSSFVREASYALAGFSLPVSEPDEELVILGIDRAGEQLSIRDRLKPLYAFVLLIMEAIALGALIASEIQQRTVTAILATPARLSDVLAAKGVIGALLSFSPMCPRSCWLSQRPLLFFCLSEDLDRRRGSYSLLSFLGPSW